MNVQQAKQVLRDAGYFVDYLWHLDDVPEGTDDEKLEVLEKALSNPWVFEQTNRAIWDEMQNIVLI